MPSYFPKIYPLFPRNLSLISPKSTTYFPEIYPLFPRNLPLISPKSTPDITFHYPEQPPEKGLKGVSFTVPAGTTTAIVGPTGAGNFFVEILLVYYWYILGIFLVT